MTAADHANKWERLCSATIALAVAWAELRNALHDYTTDRAPQTRHGRGCGCTPCRVEDWDAVDAALATDRAKEQA